MATTPLEARRLVGHADGNEPTDYIATGDGVVVTERFYPGAEPARPVDGRTTRGRRSRTAILTACRQLMRAGALRPCMAWVCETADRNTRTGFQHFRGIEDLHLEAIQDYSTRTAIAARVLGDELNALSPEAAQRLVRALVLGRLE